MTFTRRQVDERKAIHERPKRRPYASRVKFELNRGGFEFPEACTILGENGSLIELEVTEGHSVGETRQVSVAVRGFATAAIAEEQGLKLSAAVLWAAITRGVPLRLNYHTPFPSIVYDRTIKTGGGLSMSADAYTYSKFSYFVESLRKVFDRDGKPDAKLLVAMELFTSARLEATERTRFLGMVSSLEPIAFQQLHGETVDALVDEYLVMLKSCEICEAVKNSLRGSIQRLKMESVGFAIKRLIQETLPDDQSAIPLVTHAYNVRSKLLHDGQADADLDTVTRRLELLVRRLIARRLNIELDG